MKARNATLLLLTVAIWGVVFATQSVGMDYAGPLTLNCVRSLISGVVLLPCIWYFDRGRARMQQIVSIPGTGKTLVTGGVCYGVFLYLASNFQQLDVQYTTVEKMGSIIACYIIIVLILELFSKEKCDPMIVGAVVLSMARLYLLCVMGGDLSVNKGDLLTLVCTTFFTVHIMIVGFFSPVVDGVKMSCIRFSMCGVLSGMGMLLYETPDMGQILAVWTPAFYAGVVSYDVTYILQIIGQRRTDPMVASLILSLESSISILVGWAILSQKLTARELTGCVLISTTIILAQLPVGRRSTAKAQEA